MCFSTKWTTQRDQQVLGPKNTCFFGQKEMRILGYTPGPLCTTAPGVTSGILQVVIVSVINYPTVNLDFNKPANYVNIHYRSKLEGGQVSSVVEQMFKPVQISLSNNIFICNMFYALIQQCNYYRIFQNKGKGTSNKALFKYMSL